MIEQPAAQLTDGATGPALNVTFTRSGLPVDLTGLTVQAVVSRAKVSLSTLTKACQVLNPPTAGKVQLGWGAGDLQNVTLNTVTYEVDFIITAIDGSTEKPAQPLIISVRPSVS